MSPIDTINKYYKQSVVGIRAETLTDCDRWYNCIQEKPEHLQAVYTYVILYRQVYNGGFHQYFANGYGLFVELTIHYLKQMGAAKCSAIVQEAMEAINTDGYSPEELQERIFSNIMPAIRDFDETLCYKLEVLDNRYYNLEKDGEDIEALMAGYLVLKAG